MRWLTQLCLLLLAIPVSAQKQAGLPPELAGHWRGEGSIMAAWCQQKRIPFDITIDTQGNVTGMIGDAKLQDGRLTYRTRLMRKLGNRDYLIQAKLNGPIVAAEGIQRKKIWLMVDLKNQQLEGGMNTSGWHLGTKNRMFITVAQVVLTRMTE